MGIEGEGSHSLSTRSKHGMYYFLFMGLDLVFLEKYVGLCKCTIFIDDCGRESHLGLKDCPLPCLNGKGTQSFCE